VTIIRERHAFQGVALEVLGLQQRRGVLHVLVVLPDGTRSLVPAAWTDLQALQPQEGPPPSKRAQTASLAPGAALLHARTVVDALLKRMDAANTALPSPPSVSQECSRAAAEPSRTTSPVAGRPRARVAKSGGGTTRTSRRTTRATNRRSSRSNTRSTRR
jgi:hypothetical protein